MKTKRTKTGGGNRVRAQAAAGVKTRSGMPAYRTIYADIRRQIVEGKFQPGSVLPGEKVFSERLGTNRCTLRQALTLLKGEGLLRAIPQIGWEVVSSTPTPKLPAGGEVNGVTVLAVAGLLFAHGSIDGERRRLAQYGIRHRIRLFEAYENALPEIGEELAEEGRIGGILLHTDSRLSETFRGFVAERRIPLVCCGLQEHCGFDTAAPDNAMALATLVEHARAKGHDRILYVSSRDLCASVPSFKLRLEGYLQAMRECGLPPETLLLEYNRLRTPQHEAQFLQRVTALTAGGRKLCVLFHTEDYLADGCAVLARAGIPVPELVSVACVGTPEVRVAQAFGRDGFTHVRERWEDAGALAADLLVARLRGGDGAPRLGLVPPVFVDHGSVV